MSRVIFLSGPPKAGKSRLRGDIYRSLLFSGRRDWFVQVLSPDCEGQWVNDSHSLGRGEEAEELARRQKAAVKAAGEFFSPRFVSLMASQLKGLLCAFPLVIGDLGGLPSPENATIVAAAEGHEIFAVVLLGPQGDGGWTSWWEERGVTPLVTSYCDDLAEDILAWVGGPGGEKQ